MATAKKGNSSDPAKKGTEEPQGNKDLEELKAALKKESEERGKMLQGLQSMALLLKNQGAAIEKLSKAPEPAKATPAKKSPGNDQDLEALSRKDFMAVMFDGFSDVLEEKLKGISDRMETLSNDLESTSATSEVERVRSKHKDFDNWKAEVSKELQRVPDMSVEDALLLAKSKNPEKVDQLRKEAEKQDAEARKASEQGSKQPFGGMRPSGGGEIEERTDMDDEESAEKAWEDLQESVGGEAELNKMFGNM